MLGTLDRTAREAVVVGGGVSGLLAAHFLDRAGFEVTLIEASPRAGGLIETVSAPLGIVERAAHSLLATPAVISLCAELGVELREARRESRARYVWRGGRMRRFPLSPNETVAALSRALFARAPQVEPGTLDEWARRHVGTAALEYLVTPFVRGIYAADPSELSVRAAFPSLVAEPGRTLVSSLRAKRARGGDRVARGPRARMSAPLRGMGDLVSRLEGNLLERLGARFRRGERVDRVPDAANVVVCVPAPEAARLLRPRDPSTSRALSEVAYAPMVSVTAFARKDSLPSPVRGVGVLVAKGEAPRCLGILFNSSCFPGRVRDEQAWGSFTLMMGGSADSGVILSSDDEIQASCETDLRLILGWRGGEGALETRVTRWERAIPRYDDRIEKAWVAARSGWCARPGRILFGNYAGQVSLRGMIEQAASLAAPLHP